MPLPSTRPHPEFQATASTTELLRQVIAGLMPATPDLAALLDRMETAK
jgi:hypothetical protein